MYNIYQQNVPWGRVYSYNSVNDMVIDDALKAAKKYDIKEFVDHETNNFSRVKATDFINNNKTELSKELTASECFSIGIKKEWLY
tara:strand:- start:1512 stop:1766 length:255 start_codon:yes stop_codon:yes gene_type:complete